MTVAIYWSEVGIRAAKAKLAMPDGQLPAALVERFDREPAEPGRRHDMSAQTLLEARILPTARATARRLKQSGN